jgi:hypothetical protein
MPDSGPTLEFEPYPIQLSEIYKLIGYIDDVKPAITSMAEFTMVWKASYLFEKASGCILQRDPLGRWKGTDHLDMDGF